MTDKIAIDYVNELRSNPVSLIHKFSTVSKALSRARRKVQSKEVTEIINKLKEMQPLKKLEKSKGLSIIAEEMVKKMLFHSDENFSFSDDEFKLLIKKNLYSYKNVTNMITVGELENLTVRLLISEQDPKREYMKSIFSSDIKYIGAYSRQFDEDDLTVIVIAEDIQEIVIEDEYPELREMFKALDQHNTGYLIPDVIYDSLISLQYDIKNQTFVNIFNMLRKTNPNGVDYSCFKAAIVTYHIKPIQNKNDWRKVFTLFVDDSLHDTISINNIKRIATFLNEDISILELKKYMKWASDNGSELTFDEFYEVMALKYEEI
jgi:Ca2+-binding EF-hand superfamily protein